MLQLSLAAKQAIIAHAEAEYPNECVGLLFGQFEGSTKIAIVAHPVPNRWEGQVELAATDDPTSKRDRFYLDPRDYLRADRLARSQGFDIIGCYHSHPDWPAEPSERDRIGAQAIAGGASFAFVIQSVRTGQAAELASWLLAEDGSQFSAEEVHIGE